MNLPRISIITPSFNQGNFLEETIDSVLSQNYTNLEYIIIDGGSTDNSVDIIKRYDKHLTFWVSEKDNGQSHAINKGLKRSTGTILSWLCSDDLYEPQTLNKVAGYFQEDSNIQFIHGKSIVFGKGQPVIKGADAHDLHLRYFAHMPFPQPSSFFSRTVVDNLGFLNESLHYGMDFDLLIRVALNYNIKQVPDIFSKYRLHDESKSVSQLQHFLNDWIKVFSKCARTISLQKEYIEILNELNMYHTGEDIYSSSKSFNLSEKKKITLLFLENLLHVYYELLDLNQSGKICKAIKILDSHYYYNYGIHSIHTKTKFLNKSALKLLRKIYRKKHSSN